MRSMRWYYYSLMPDKVLYFNALMYLSKQNLSSVRSSMIFNENRRAFISSSGRLTQYTLNWSSVPPSWLLSQFCRHKFLTALSEKHHVRKESLLVANGLANDCMHGHLPFFGSGSITVTIGLIIDQLCVHNCGTPSLPLPTNVNSIMRQLGPSLQRT